MTDLTTYARQGWQMVGGNPYCWSSDLWLAFEAGAQARRLGWAECVRARKSRGYSIRYKPAGGAGQRIVFDTKTLEFKSTETDHGA